MDGSSKSETSQSDCELISTRLLHFSREEIFAACSDPLRLARWWGPAGFSNTFEQFEFRPGGAWKLIMHGPDGNDYANEWEFAEIEPPSRLVLIHLRPMHRFRLEMTFAPEASGTRLTWHMTFDDAEELARVKQFIIPANEQNFDRLEGELAK